MSDQRETQRCNVCGGINTPETSASITQWIQRCSCRPGAVDNGAGALTLCSTCGKRVDEGRAGSFTQWVFRADVCKCGVKSGQSSNSRPRGSSIESDNAGVNEIDLEENPELNIDPATFPATRYVARALIGGGAGGSVYLCIDKLLTKKVAVKILNSLSTEKVISFQNEARALSSLTHDNIIKVLDFGVTEGDAPYMVMEYLSGMSLDKLLTQQKRLEDSDAIEVFKQVCDALSHAHNRKVFHRDVKCSNILIADPDKPAQQVKLIDFGVASFKPDEFNTMIHGITLVGTPQYMSPDQANSIPYDARSEVYSVGCSLFEALTGSPPFSGESALDLINKHAHEPPPTLSDMDPNSDFPEELERVVARCLEKAPKNRYQSVADLKADLTRLTADTDYAPAREAPLLGNDYQKTNESAVSKKRRPFLIPLAVTVAGAILTWVVFVGSTILKPEQSPKISSPTFDNDLTIDVKLPAIASISPDAAEFKTKRIGNRVWLIPKGKILDRDLAALQNRSDFNVLSLDHQGLTGLGLKYLPGCTNLYALSLQGTPISPEGVEHLLKLVNLEEIVLSSTDLTNDTFRRLVELPKLRSVLLQDTEIDDETVTALCDLQNLQLLNLGYARNVNGPCLSNLARLPKLSRLTLNDTGLKPEYIRDFKAFPHLTVLSLRRTRLTDRDIEPLANTKTLTYLDLSDNLITDVSINTLEKISSLKKLLVRNCRLTKEGIADLRKKLPNCEVVGTV